MESNSACNHQNYNLLAFDWFKKVLFSTNSLAKLLSDSLLLAFVIGLHHGCLVAIFETFLSREDL